MMILVETICSSYTWLHTLHKLEEVLEFWDRNNTADGKGMYMNVQYCKIQQLNKCDPQRLLTLKYKAQSWVLWIIRLCWIVTKNYNLLLFCRCVDNADLIPCEASQLSLRITVCWTIPTWALFRHQSWMHNDYKKFVFVHPHYTQSSCFTDDLGQRALVGKVCMDRNNSVKHYKETTQESQEESCR